MLSGSLFGPSAIAAPFLDVRAGFELEIFDAGSALIPLLDGFDIDATDILKTLANEVGNEVAADKAAAAAHNDFFTLHNAVLEY